MGKSLAAKCPFRQKSSSRILYLIMSRSRHALTIYDLSRKSRLPVDQVSRLVHAYQNPWHRIPLERVGVRVSRVGRGRYKLAFCKAKPNSRRPLRKKATKSNRAVKTKGESPSSEPVVAE